MENNQKMAFTLTEAADAINVSVPTMRSMLHQPGFPAFRAGKRWVIPVDEFRAWLGRQAAERAEL